jgi:hypothetical protein
MLEDNLNNKIVKICRNSLTMDKYGVTINPINGIQEGEMKPIERKYLSG